MFLVVVFRTNLGFDLRYAQICSGLAAIATLPVEERKKERAAATRATAGEEEEGSGQASKSREKQRRQRGSRVCIDSRGMADRSGRENAATAAIKEEGNSGKQHNRGAAEGSNSRGAVTRLGFGEAAIEEGAATWVAAMTKAKGEGSGDMKQGIGGCARVEQRLRRDSNSQRVAMAVGGGISKAEGVEGRGGTATTGGVGCYDGALGDWRGRSRLRLASGERYR
ncbi:hypothetical protein B296_00030334 [Ensete ventricosum]|uniref:Uncharacterized protein n=1 Tax=Ensete ventricosum TaxID=4639 RepID=A0A426ZQ15_ENSVE|nr:hypothetical protein B296_00030334 [Ensete ventricosum]